MFTTQQLTRRWEDQRAIKNLMGKYANCVLLNDEQLIFDMFWSKTQPDVCLGFNDGYYGGAADVRAYYDACRDRNMLVAALLQKRFPEQLGAKSREEIYGTGPFKVKPLSCPVIEVAADGKTAKGLWYCQGAYNEVETCGPVARWTWGYFAADFILEDDAWRIWHLQCTNDVDCICGQSWGKPPVPYPELPEFAELGNFKYPGYTGKTQLRRLYGPNRPAAKAPTLPEPYDTFADTFSYGL